MIIKIIALALIGSFVSVFLKKHNRELIPFFEVAVMTAGFFLIKDSLTLNNSAVDELFRLYPQGEEMFLCMFKASAVTVITKLTSETCRESGNGLMGEIVELGGRVMLVVLSMPFILQVAKTALSFIK